MLFSLLESDHYTLTSSLHELQFAKEKTVCEIAGGKSSCSKATVKVDEAFPLVWESIN